MKYKKKILRYIRRKEKNGEVIFLIELSRLLKIAESRVLPIVQALYRKKRLEIYDETKVRSFKPGFRFPEEIRSILKMIAQDETNYGIDAAKDFVEELERIVEERHLKKFSSLKCWGKHWPYLSKTLRRMAVTNLLLTKRLR